MKLSQLIREAEAARTQYGDLDVVIEVPGDEFDLEATQIFKASWPSNPWLFTVCAPIDAFQRGTRFTPRKK